MEETNDRVVLKEWQVSYLSQFEILRHDNGCKVSVNPLLMLCEERSLEGVVFGDPGVLGDGISCERKGQ